MDSEKTKQGGEEQALNSPVGRTLIAFLICSLMLGFFQSSALVTASYDLPPGGISAVVVKVAEGWHGLMTASGMAELSLTIRDWMDDVQSQEF